MLELLLCSMVTILPDYLFRRFGQGKRLGREITLYSVWFELRWGITACLLLTVSLITLIFYFHPSTNSAIAAFRTVTILPETGGRVAEVYVGLNDVVDAGQPLFRLDDAAQRAAVEVATRRIAEVDAEIGVARAELAGMDGQIRQAEAAYRQALNEFETRAELLRRNSNTVSIREVERMEVAVDQRQGAVDSALASKETLQIRLATLLPAQKASAEASLAQARVDLDKTVVRAGVSGRVQQFALRAGDVVNPLLRPAGILVPTEAGRAALVAGFSQIEAQVMEVGMIGEVTCVGLPFTIIPVVVTQVQHVVAAGQVRASDQLLDVQQLARPGTLTVFMEPLYPGQLADVPAGSSCIANAYTSNHEALASGDVGFLRGLFLHVIDAIAVVHAMILRLQAILLPVQTLVLGGH